MRLPASRGERIGIAATTGAVAKALSLIAQVIAVGVAVRSLHSTGFAVFATIASVVSWMNLASLGVAPGLTLGIAEASADASRSREARLFKVSLLVISGVAAGVVMLVVILAQGAWLDTLLEATPFDAGDARSAFVLMALLIAFQLILSVPEAAQLAYQQQWISNSWAILGSAGAIVVLLASVSAITSISAFVAVSQGPPAAARLMNAISVLWSRRYLLTGRWFLDQTLARHMLQSGVAFAGIQFGGYVALQFGVLVLAATSDAAQVALAALLLRATSMASGVVMLVTTPAWPALAEAVSRGDSAWAIRLYRRLPVGMTAYAVAVALAIVFRGEWFLRLWTGQPIRLDQGLAILFGAYFVAGVWSHSYATILLGLGRITSTATVLVCEALVIGFLELVLIPTQAVVGYAAALLLGTALISCWVLPRRAKRAVLAAIEIADNG